MKTKKILIFILSFFIIANLSEAAPVITNVTVNPSANVSVFDKLEITFNLNNYANPYDPAVINAYAEFWSPTGKYYKVFAFYYSDYNKTNSNCTPYQCEILTANGINNWKIRFTPDEAGSWQYRISASDNAGTTVYPAVKKTIFTCVSSNNEGFIVKANSKFLERTTGEFFFPVGQNVSWYGSPVFWGQQTFGTNEYQYYIDSVAGSNANFIRVWLDMYEGMALIGYDFTTQQNYFNLYNQKDAYQLDLIFNYAKAKGVNIMLCLFSHASWGDAGYCCNSWSNRNPFNSANGGMISTPFQFFSNQTAINTTKNLVKYIISRWGFATNLVAWELWNEVGQIEGFNPNLTPPSTYSSDLLNWHVTMYNYIKSIDPFQHLVTTSYAGGITSSNQAIFSAMDFTQSHDYKDPIANTNDDFQNHFYAVAQGSMNTISKPYMCGEWGFADPSSWSQYDPKGFELHNSLWSSAFSTSLGAVSNWYWDSYIKPRDLFSLYKPVSIFMNSIPLPSSAFTSHKIANTNGLRTYYMLNSGADTIYGWTQDIAFHFQNLRQTANGNNYLQTLNPSYKPGTSSTDNRIYIPVGQNNRQYIMKWYNALSGQLYQSNSSLSVNNNLVINIPQALRNSTYGDAVFAIYLDCDRYIWREGTLSNNTYQNVSGNVVCNKTNGQVFYKTSDNKIHSMWWNPAAGTWQWSALNNAASNVGGDLAITQDGSQIFYRTTDNKLNSIWWDSSIQNWQWSDLNNAANGNVRGPVAVSSNGQVFYRTLDYKLNNIWWNSSDGSWEWSNLNNAVSGNAGDAIAISSNVQVFYKTLDNKLNNIWWNSSTGTWWWSGLNNAANGNVCGNITITPNDQVFYRTCDNKLNNIWWNYSTGQWNWSGLNNAANNVAGDLMADNAGKVFYRTTNNNINCIYWVNGTWLWSGLDDATAGNVYPGNLATDNLGNVFFRASDNRIHRIYYKSQCFDILSPNFRNYNEFGEYTPDEDSAISTIRHDGGISVYPNPANEKVMILFTESFDQLSIYDTRGCLVLGVNPDGQRELVIDVSEFRDGVFFVQAVSGKQFKYEKFVVKH